jgi:hypothetical protein
MSKRLEALEQDVERLDEVELKDFARWFAEFQDRRWERKVEQDAHSGKLDFLLQEALSVTESGSHRKL